MRTTGARGDAGSIVIGWLVRLALVLAVLGVSAFDAIAVAVAHLNGSDDASTAASAAAQEWQASHDVDRALTAAENAVTNPDEQVLPSSLRIDPDGSAHLSLQRKATTLVMYKIGPLKKYTVIVAKGDAGPPS
jgi:hypothetical protein